MSDEAEVQLRIWEAEKRAKYERMLLIPGKEATARAKLKKLDERVLRKRKRLAKVISPNKGNNHGNQGKEDQGSDSRSSLRSKEPGVQFQGDNRSHEEIRNSEGGRPRDGHEGRAQVREDRPFEDLPHWWRGVRRHAHRLGKTVSATPSAEAVALREAERVPPLYYVLYHLPDDTGQTKEEL